MFYCSKDARAVNIASSTAEGLGVLTAFAENTATDVIISIWIQIKEGKEPRKRVWRHIPKMKAFAAVLHL